MLVFSADERALAIIHVSWDLHSAALYIKVGYKWPAIPLSIAS